MQIDEDVKLDFCDVLLKPRNSEIRSRSEIDLHRTFNFKYSNVIWTGIPIISSNMTSVTTPDVARAMAKHDMLSCKPKQLHWTALHHSVISSVGLEDKINIFDTRNFLALDVPNGHISAVVDRVKEIRDQFQESVVLIVGNVVTQEGVEALIDAGADVVKIGLGNGSGCRTRIAAGVGYPQLSAIAECSAVARARGAHIISDGGCLVPGDLAKAFAAGADFVMLGGMLAGFLENGQDFYGSSSERGNNETAGGLKNYRTSEGWEMKLPPKGPIEATLNDILGGLRSACSYVGAHSLEDISKNAAFIRVNRQANTSLWDHRV